MSEAELPKESLVNIGRPNLGDKVAPAALPAVYIRTYGCQMNHYDSEKMQKILENRYRTVERPEDADLILLNTCSVREKPEHKVFSALGEYRDYKRAKPSLLIGVGGCVAQQEGERIIKRDPGVDFVFGTHNLSLIPSLIDRRIELDTPQVAVDYRDEWEDLPLGFAGDGRVSIPIAISRGCDKNCAYCIVPTTRGKEVSRAEDEILREARIAAHRGAKEIMLLGQTVNSWGKDLQPRRRFTDLLESVSQVEGIERIRFISPHPQDVREDFIDLVCANPKIARHIHLPLQSGSDRILKLMNRNYRQKRYLDIVRSLRERLPDIIEGFPQETREDFEQTLAVIREVDFDGSYSYSYSPRPGTTAATMEGQISAEDKALRLKELQTLQDSITARRLEAWVGRTAEVLLDGWSRHSGDILQGRISQNILVNLDKAYPALGPGMTIPVSIEVASRYTLRASLQERV
jgi:tRNA-2-methylthio-N6-dimethylallyladenosine synthase